MGRRCEMQTAERLQQDLGSRVLDLRNCRGRSWPINRPFMTTKVSEEDLVNLFEIKQNRGRPLVWIDYILVWVPCPGKVNKILLGMTAKPKPLYERHRCRIERRNDTTCVGSDTKPSPKVWQSPFHVNKTEKDNCPFAMSVGCTFSVKRLQNRVFYFLQRCRI